LAERAGFARANTSELPVWHQVQLFADASQVIGINGAGLANLVFCRPGTAVLEVRPDGGAPWTWRHLAAMRGLRYGCLEGPAIDPAAFDAVLNDPRFA
jgi:capsular polysaccharide biosynthesis protein